jgi:hypothetical protein
LLWERRVRQYYREHSNWVAFSFYALIIEVDPVYISKGSKWQMLCNMGIPDPARFIFQEAWDSPLVNMMDGAKGMTDYGSDKKH